MGLNLSSLQIAKELDLSPSDTRAIRILEQCFPTRPILPVYSRDLVWGLGTIHCLTQQEPAT